MCVLGLKVMSHSKYKLNVTSHWIIDGIMISVWLLPKVSNMIDMSLLNQDKYSINARKYC